jgi:hypothetical protein
MLLLPSLTFAQTVPASTTYSPQYIASLQKLLALLEQELAMLIAQQSRTSVQPVATPIASVTTGTIDQTSLTGGSNGPFTITGTAPSSSSVSVYMLNLNYTGATDYATIVAANTSPTTSANPPHSAWPSPVAVTNGHWSAYFGGSEDAGFHRIVVYDANSHALVASGTLNVTAQAITPGMAQFQANLQATIAQQNAQAAAQAAAANTSTAMPTCTLTTNATAYTTGAPVTFIWTSTGANYAEWVRDVNLTGAFSSLATGQMAAAGSETVPTTIPGGAQVMLAVFGPGGEGLCRVNNFSVTGAPASASSLQFSAQPISATAVATANNSLGTSQTGTFTISFNVTANGQQPIYFSPSPSSVTLQIMKNGAATSVVPTMALSSQAPMSSSGNYVVYPGQTKSVTVTASVNSGSGPYSMTLTSFKYGLTDSMPASSTINLPSTYQTSSVTLQNS